MQNDDPNQPTRAGSEPTAPPTPAQAPAARFDTPPPREPAKVAAAQGTSWERQTIEKLAFAALKEQRSARRWGIFFKLLTFGYITLMVVAFVEFPMFGKKSSLSDKHTALVE